MTSALPGKTLLAFAQEYTEELYQKDLHDQDNHDGVITHLEPDILECGCLMLENIYCVNIN